MSFDEAKQDLEKKQICGRLLDNDPRPMKGCNFCDCDKCELKITKFVAVEDIEAVLGDLQKTLKAFCKDVLEIQAGISWYDVEKENDRIFKFIETNFPELLKTKAEKLLEPSK